MTAAGETRDPCTRSGDEPPFPWPDRLLDAVMNPDVTLRISDTRALIAGQRPASSRFDPAQTHTAAIFETKDRSRTWNELPLRIVLHQYILPRAWFNWPPEAIDRIDLEHGFVTIHFEDPWIVWEPGRRWKAHWIERRRRWLSVLVQSR